MRVLFQKSILTVFLNLILILFFSACGKRPNECGGGGGGGGGNCGNQNFAGGDSNSNPSGGGSHGGGNQGGVRGAVNCNGQNLSRPCVDQSETFRVFSRCGLPVRQMCDVTGLNPGQQPVFCIAGSTFFTQDEVLRSCNPS